MAETTLAAQINKLAARMGRECKTITTNIGTLTDLETEGKSSLVVALNEVESKITTAQGSLTGNTAEIAKIKTDLAKKVEINDTTPSATTVYSSSKVNSQITAAKQAVKNDLLGGAGEAYDTLKELGALIDTNKSAIDALKEVAVGHVKFDGAQTLTDTQKKQARDNIGVASDSALTAQGTRLSAVEGKATQTQSDVSALKTSLGALDTDFVAAFETAYK